MAGGPPNRGWFAANPDKGEPPAPGEPEPPPPGGSWRDFLRDVRDILKDTANNVLEAGQLALWAASEIKDAIEADIALLEGTQPADLAWLVQRAIEQARASLDPPKTLAEMQTPPTQNALGYERHHIVEQNPDNIAKTPVEVVVEKFGRQAIDAPSNLVWVPRLKHELITAYYNGTDKDDADGRLHRQVVNAMDFDAQYDAGLQALEEFGVLQ